MYHYGEWNGNVFTASAACEMIFLLVFFSLWCWLICKIQHDVCRLVEFIRHDPDAARLPAFQRSQLLNVGHCMWDQNAQKIKRKQLFVGHNKITYKFFSMDNIFKATVILCENNLKIFLIRKYKGCVGILLCISQHDDQVSVHHPHETVTLRTVNCIMCMGLCTCLCVTIFIVCAKVFF